jgi:uncharacterized protein (DUF983 family)
LENKDKVIQSVEVKSGNSCVHSWEIEQYPSVDEVGNKQFKGICKKCKEEKMFKAYITNFPGNMSRRKKKV